MSELNYFKQNMIENIAENVVADQVKSKKEELKDMGMIEEVKSFFVKEICCGAVNTVVLTNTGTVIVFGDNTYG
jgi:alpha-tubulin suppressor-like RCC1 family protein